MNNKTPEQLAEEYVAHNRSYPYDPLNAQDRYMRNSYLAGYQAAKDQYKEAIDTYNDVAKQMLEEAVRIMSPQDQLADADKVIAENTCEHILYMEKMVDVNSSNNSNGWISVKERLPALYVAVLASIVETVGDRKINDMEVVTYRSGVWLSVSTYYPEEAVTHWMPLPKPPEEK